MYRFDVEVVRGLVEEDDFGFLQEDFGKADAHLPAVTEGGHGLMEFLAQEAHTEQHFFGFGIHRIASQMVISVVEVGKLLGQLSVCFGFVIGAFSQFCGNLLHFAFHHFDFREGGDGFFPHG